MKPAIMNNAITANTTTNIALKTPANCHTRPCASLVNKIIEAMAPGPAINGMLRGKTEGSRSSSSLSSPLSLRRLPRSSNNISSAVRNNNTPPAIWKAGIEMPAKLKTDSPSKPNSERMKKAMMQARRAMALRFFGAMPWVSATNTGAKPIGSITTNRVAKAVNSIA